MFFVERSSFREKVNFRLAMEKVADVLTRVYCSSTAVFLTHRRIKARNSSALVFRLLS